MKLLYTLGRYNLNYVKIVNTLISDEKDSPLNKLKNIVLSQVQHSDKAVMIKIYGKQNQSAFSKLKTRLADVLIRVIVLQNVTNETADSRINENYQQFRQTLAVNLLIYMREYSLSIELAERAIKKSIKFHYTENIILLAKLLVGHFGSREFNRYKYNKYFLIQSKYLRIQQLEFKAEHYFLDLQRLQLQSLAPPSELTIEKARKYVKELDSVKDINTYTFFINRYKVKAAYHEYQRDYNSLLSLSETTRKDFIALKFKSNAFLININSRKYWALIQAGRNEEVILNGMQFLNKTPSGSLGWYFIAHYTLKALLYKGNYEHSTNLITLMIENSKFKKISENYRELFYTTLGYIHLIADSGLIRNTSNYKAKLPEFKLYKFLNAVPVLSKDKRGINVSILLMHVAFLLQRKDYDAIIDRVDSLNHYAYRHLRKDDTFRSNCMIKMVIQMTKADFNPIRTKRYTEGLLNQLEQVKLAGSGVNIETEIIPYEVLWKIMTKSL